MVDCCIWYGYAKNHVLLFNARLIKRLKNSGAMEIHVSNHNHQTCTRKLTPTRVRYDLECSSDFKAELFMDRAEISTFRL
jgi:hypothetical protein